jgi:hypothetical protein
MKKNLLTIATLAGSLLLSTAASAAPGPSGTLVGTVTCGPAEETHAANIRVAVEGLPLGTHTDGAGKFTLSGVPAAQSFTIDALGSPDAFSMASRTNVAVQPGQTLDIGNLDLSVCPRPAQDVDDQSPQDRRDAFSD